jgi:hypothetical protein
MNEEEAVAQLAQDVSADIGTELTDLELQSIVRNCLHASPWATGTAITAGTRILPTAGNGRIYRALSSGTTDTTEPAWPTFGQNSAGSMAGYRIADNDVYWADDGPAPSSVYDMRRARYEAFLLKASKTAHLVSVSSGPDRLSLDQRHDHYLGMAKRNRPFFAV